MAFENTTLAVAESCGIEHAYFFEGTMFFDADNASNNAIEEFQLIYPKSLVSSCGDEVAIDFTE